MVAEEEEAVEGAEVEGEGGPQQDQVEEHRQQEMMIVYVLIFKYNDFIKISIQLGFILFHVLLNPRSYFRHSPYLESLLKGDKAVEEV